MRCFAIVEPETQAQICIFFTNTVNITMLLGRQKNPNVLMRRRIWPSADNYDEAIVKVTTQHTLDIGDTKLEENDDTAVVR